MEYTRRLAKALKVKGLLNIQFIVKDNQVYVIEANPRSSRTVPYISKVTDIPIVPLAVGTFFGKTLPEMGYEYGLQPEKELIAIKTVSYTHLDVYKRQFLAWTMLSPSATRFIQSMLIPMLWQDALAIMWKARVGAKSFICPVKKKTACCQSSPSSLWT